jgi:hypothetical protein
MSLKRKMTEPGEPGEPGEPDKPGILKLAEDGDRGCFTDKCVVYFIGMDAWRSYGITLDQEAQIRQMMSAQPQITSENIQKITCMGIKMRIAMSEKIEDMANFEHVDSKSLDVIIHNENFIRRINIGLIKPYIHRYPFGRIGVSTVNFRLMGHLSYSYDSNTKHVFNS